ncbi:MAG: hypothetical protein ACLR23_20585 [Clostridia bacterium]
MPGIEARWWVRFLKLFDERGDEEAIRIRFERLAQSIGRGTEWTEEVVQHVMRLMEM